MKNLLPCDGEVYYIENFLSKKDQQIYFEKIIDETQWKHFPIKIFGKEIMQPRLVDWYGSTPIRYSGIELPAKNFTKTLHSLNSKVEQALDDKFNGVLLNLYRDQKDSMGWHQDNEKELGENPVIASLSLGQKRDFQFKHIKDKNLKLSLELASGSLLVMRGQTQNFWKHALPKRSASMQKRLNLTFRKMFFS